MKNETEFVEIEKPTERDHYAPQNESGGKKNDLMKNDETELGESWIKVALGLREDLSLKYVFVSHFPS